MHRGTEGRKVCFAVYPFLSFIGLGYMQWQARPFRARQSAFLPKFYRGWVYFFSTRRNLVILHPNKLEINSCVNSLAIISPRYVRICRRGIKQPLPHTHYVRAAHTEKTHPTPVWVNLIFKFRILGICCSF